MGGYRNTPIFPIAVGVPMKPWRTPERLKQVIPRWARRIPPCTLMVMLAISIVAAEVATDNG